MFRRVKNILHAFEADLAGFFFGRPSKKIPTIGITGTDGKTTTTSLIFHILKHAGYNPAMISTVAAQIGDREFDTGLHTTTPSAFSLQKYIKRAVSAGCSYLILEVTSHSLDQNRVRGIDFKIGVLTNITQDHFDYHKDYESYVRAKSKLFAKSDVAVLNLDDKSFDLINASCRNKKVYSYSLKKDADFTPMSIGIALPAQFEFNYENFLAAVAVAKLLEVPEDIIKLSLSTFKFPAGRQEIIYEADFKVIIDFAHTPNSFGKVLPALKSSTKGRLIHVFGAAGLRDRSKRPLMGAVSSKYANVIILTSEDPRRENIAGIDEQIKLGIVDYKGEFYEIADRQEAIDFAIKLAKKGDTVVVTGKGHEKSMNLGKGEIPWSEHEAVERALKKNIS